MDDIYDFVAKFSQRIDETEEVRQQKQLSNRGLFSVFTKPHLNTRGSWENLKQLCKPETQSRVRITVENPPNSPNCLDEAT